MQQKNDNFYLKPVNESEIFKIINKLKNKKSFMVDEISNSVVNQPCFKFENFEKHT